MHANADIMKDLFRGTWNYSGFFGSDWGNIKFLTNSHIAANISMAASLAISAGVDQAFCDEAYYPGTINPAIASGSISQADVDRAVYNVLASKFAAGLVRLTPLCVLFVCVCVCEVPVCEALLTLFTF